MSQSWGVRGVSPGCAALGDRGEDVRGGGIEWEVSREDYLLNGDFECATIGRDSVQICPKERAQNNCISPGVQSPRMS